MPCSEHSELGEANGASTPGDGAGNACPPAAIISQASEPDHWGLGSGTPLAVSEPCAAPVPVEATTATPSLGGAPGSPATHPARLPVGGPVRDNALSAGTG